MSRYVWEEDKARDNVAKHGVSFEEAETVDLDPQHLGWPDVRYLEDDRFVKVGYSLGGLLLVVVVSERGPKPRLISARRATKRERHAYEARP